MTENADASSYGDRERARRRYQMVEAQRYGPGACHVGWHCKSDLYDGGDVGSSRDLATEEWEVAGCPDAPFLDLELAS